MLRVHRIPYSTNVERVAIAAACKGVAVEWVDHDPADRSAIRALSGQDLVPVAELPGGEIVFDSMAIVERLEAMHPDPPLYPADPAARARLDVFVAWFNRVWKIAPNAIEAEEAAAEPDAQRIERLGEELSGSRGIFEGLLADGPYLMGAEYGAADVCAYPFMRWAVLDAAPPEAHRFEHILVERLGLRGGYPRLRTWIQTVANRPDCPTP